MKNFAQKLSQYNKTTSSAVSLPITTTIPTKPIGSAQHNLTLDGNWWEKKFNLYLFENHNKCSNALMNFAQQCRRKEYLQVRKHSQIKMDGIPVIWGNKNESKDLILQCWEQKIDFVQMDLPYLANWSNMRTAGVKEFRLSINRLHKNKIGSYQSTRWNMLKKRLAVNFAPWKTFGEYVLIIPPSEEMAALFGIDINIWLDKTIAKIRANTQLDVKVRFKPLSFAARGSLKDDLRNAKCLVTYNSNAALEALIAGVPVITNNIGPAAPLSIRFDQIDDTPDLDRTGLFNMIAYSQWDIDDIAKGNAMKTTMMEYSFYRGIPPIDLYFDDYD